MIYLSNLVAGLDTGLENTAMLANAVALFNGQVGIEFFLHSHSERYRQALRDIPSWIGTLPLTTHGPFIGVEATAPPLSPTGENLFASYRFALETARFLGSRHLVFHSNECFVTPEQKPLLQRQCLDNLDTLIEWAACYGVTLLLENLGLPSKGTPLFNENEFIALFDRYPQAGCLLDMGHLHLAGWDDERVIKSLCDRVTGYHLHNNDGWNDSHQRIGNGGYNYAHFFALYRQYTPQSSLTLEYGHDHGITVPQLWEDLQCVSNSIVRCS